MTGFKNSNNNKPAKKSKKTKSNRKTYSNRTATHFAHRSAIASSSRRLALAKHKGGEEFAMLDLMCQYQYEENMAHIANGNHHLVW